MEKKENNNKKGYDSQKVNMVADVLSASISGTIARSKPQSMIEGFLILTLAVGRVVQSMARVMGKDPNVVMKDFCHTLTEYARMGGDERIDIITGAGQGKGN